jgi:hypothetical protein
MANKGIGMMICNSGPKVQHDYIGTAKDSKDKIRTI